MTWKIGVFVHDGKSGLDGNDGKGGLGGNFGKGDLTMQKEDAIRDKEKESGIPLWLKNCQLQEKRLRRNSSPEVSFPYQIDTDTAYRFWMRIFINVHNLPSRACFHSHQTDPKTECNVFSVSGAHFFHFFPHLIISYGHMLKTMLFKE